MQFFEEGVQFSFFPGDPGESDEEFDDNWTAEQEPVFILKLFILYFQLPSEIDHWATKIVKTKQVLKVESQIDDAPSSARSKRAPSIASSRKTVQMRKIQKPDSDLRSKFGDSIRDKIERKENFNISMNATQQISKEPGNQYLLVPLEVEPPRDIPDDERIMRDRKERQLKIKENELKEQREKEERDRQRMKNKMDQFAEIEKNDYTYDQKGQIIIVKKPKIQPITQSFQPEFNLNQMNASAKNQVLQAKGKTRLQSAKQPATKEIKVKLDVRKDESVLEVKAQQDLDENYKKMFSPQEETLKDYGLQKDLDIQAGIMMTDKEGKKFRGPNIDRQDRMTLQEYQKVASDFQIMNQEQLSRYGSQIKLQSPDNHGSQLEFIVEDQESIDMSKRKKSPERIQKNNGADQVYERDTNTAFRINMRAKRKDLKSANVNNMNQNIINKHNDKVRITSAKAQQDVRVRKQSAKLQKERIFNYDNQIGGVDFPPQNNDVISRISERRPMSGHPSNLSNKKNLHLGNNGALPSSLIDQFNKKLVEKGTSYGVLPNDLPEAGQYLQKRKDRPQTSKAMIKTNTSKKKLGVGEINEALGQGGIYSSIISGGDISQSANMFNNKAILNKKGPRERIISAKLPRENEKLPPPPFGRTMGHGFMAKLQ